MVEVTITYVGRSDRGRKINHVVVPAFDENSLVPEHPSYGSASATSKRIIEDAKEQTRRASKHPLKKARKRK